MLRITTLIQIVACVYIYNRLTDLAMKTIDYCWIFKGDSALT